MTRVLRLFLLFILTSCFGGEEGASSGGGLFIGHKESTNAISFILPSNGTYNESDTLVFVISHPDNMTITAGPPRIVLDIGGVSRDATYVSGDGTKNLVFQYTVVAGDEDADGIEITSVETDGGSIDFSQGAVNLALPSLNTSNILVSTTPQVAITNPITSDLVNIANDTATYSVMGTCNQTGVTVSMLINSGAVSSPVDFVCDGATFSGTFDISTEADGALTLEADLMGVTSNSVAITKDTIAPNLAITSNPNIISANVSNYTISGTCDETSASVNVDIGGLTNSATCDGTNWSVSGWDLSALSDAPTIAVNVGYADAAGNPASDSSAVSKATSYTISLNALSAINIANATSYTIDGTCSNDGEAISLDIASATITDSQNCSGGAFSFSLDVSSVADNASVAIQVDHGSASDTTNVLKDTVAPTITIDALSNIDSTNVTTYSLSGTCDEVAASVNINLGGLSNTATCDGSVWSIASWDVNAEADATGINVTADITDAAGNPATQASTTVDKDTTAPSVAITSPTDSSFINIANDSAIFSVSGTCDENGATVDILVNGVSASAQSGFICDGSNFTGTIDTTALAEGALVFAAELSDGVNTGVSGNINIEKDITAPTISLNALNDINSSNEIAFNVNGSCTDDTDSISIDVGGVIQAGTCNSGAFNIDVNVSSLADGTGIAVTADITDAAGNTATQASTTVDKDATIPTVTIDFSPDITAANASSYNISGSCSENGETVSVDIDGLSFTPSCSSGSWSLSSIDVSSLADNANLPITADLQDLAGNDAIQASVTVDKNTVGPTVTINLPANDISQSNVTNYSVSGTCSENGTVVTLAVGSLNFSPNCSAGTWSMSPIDTSSLGEGAVTITADHATATQASTTISKDTLSQTVTISSAPDITISNETNYIVSGTCSDNGQNVDVYIDSLNYLLTCNSGSWSTGIIDVSSIPDGIGINVTADHSTASQATAIINKSTGTPTVSSLSVASTLSNSVDLNFNLNDPGGYTIDDYIINYRIKGSPTWLTFNDGVNTNTSPTVNSLNASTTYEFRVAVIYDTYNQSTWSNTTEGTTQPDDPIFGPYAAMNVGGSTTTTVVAYEDSTNITLNGGALVTLNQGQTHVFASSQFDVIDADKPIFTAGRRGDTNAARGANIVWNPTAWAGKSFSFNATRTSPQILEVYAVEDATIEVKQGTTVLDSTTITAGSGTTLTWSPYGSYQVVSTGTILAYHISAGGSNLHDPTPLLPSHTEIIGFPSNSMRLTTTVDSTNYFFFHSNSINNSGSLNKSGVVQINPEGTGSLFQGDSLLIQADQKISGASFADSNGLCSASFMPTNLMKTKYILPTNSDYIAFASKVAGTIEVRNSANVLVTTLTLTRSGGNSNAPYKVRMANPNAGYKFTATVPVGAWYQPNNNTGSADQDESLMFGTND